MNNKKSILKISIVILICLALFGMWIIKKNVDKINESKYEQLYGKTEEASGELDFSFELKSPVDFEKLKEKNLPLIINFSASWCGPCREMKPGYLNVYEKMIDKAFIKYVDVDESPNVSGGIPVSVVPTQAFFNADGTPFVPSKTLSESIEFTMYSKKGTNEHIYTIHQGIITEDELYIILREMGVDIK